MTNPKVTNEFDIAVQQFREIGTLKVGDATKPLRIPVMNRHTVDAKQKDPCQCVVAKSLSESQATVIAVSVGQVVTKILFEGGILLRYMTSERLRRGLMHFDETGDWMLPDGIYHLAPPSDSNKLAKNKSPEARKKLKEGWQKFEQKLKKNGATGKGLKTFQSRPIPARQVSIIRSNTPKT